MVADGPKTLIPIRVDGRFRIKDLLGSGSFGSVYRVVNIFTNKAYAIKLELCPNGSKSALEHEYNILKSFDTSNDGIPAVHWFGREANYDALVLDLLGPTLHQLMDKHHKFHVRTVVHIADQLISRLQYIHGCGYIHADIKPQNLLVGLGDQALTIFIVDFGVAKRYRDPATGSHIPFVRAHRLTGTPAFTSINSHLGARLGRRDDLESLSYLLIYFLRGSLPWLTTSSGETKSSSILEQKKNTPVEELCSGLPREFATLLTYSQTLSFSEEPDYDYMRSLLLSHNHPPISSSPVIARDLDIFACCSNISPTPPPSSPSSRDTLATLSPLPELDCGIQAAQVPSDAAPKVAKIRKRKRSSVAIQSPPLTPGRILRSSVSNAQASKLSTRRRYQ